MFEDPIEAVECIWVNIWCMLGWIWSQNCRNTLLFDTVDQIAVCISNQGSDIDWMERYQVVKARVSFRRILSKILRSSSQFNEIQIGGWLREVLNVAKTKTIRKWELNTSDNFMNLRAEDFFVG